MTILLMCRTREVPTPDHIVAAVSAQGFSAVAQAVRRDLYGYYAVEIQYQPSRMPIVIRVGLDFADEPDLCEAEFWHFFGNLQRNRPETSAVNRVGDFTLFPNKKVVHIFREKLLSELVPNEETRACVRRFIYINALENVDQIALQAVVTFIQARTDSLLGSDTASETWHMTSE